MKTIFLAFGIANTWPQALVQITIVIAGALLLYGIFKNNELD
jgi:hypothetical protein